MIYTTVSGLGRTWLWPTTDRECRRVIFDMAVDLDVALAACSRKGVVVQAGGNMGVWPWLLAAQFRMVYTFEPDPACFRCLVENVQEPNVIKLQAALSSRHGLTGLRNDHPDNLGAQFISHLGPPHAPQFMIDDLDLQACDLIYLDIEGAELLALQGARTTIQRCLPVIVVEDKGLSERFGSKQGAIERWLAYLSGYTVHARLHRDVILTPP